MTQRYHKHLEITDAMLAQVSKLAGSAILADDIVVFEATAAGTRPVKQLGSMYDGARITRDTLVRMASALNSGEQSVPLHANHETRSQLPIGRVFQAEVITSMDGEYELRAFFYLPKTEVALISSINLGVLDEVSVGLLTERAMCSSCGHDYFAPDADIYALFNRTCPNDHVLGVDGVHLVLDGVDTWSELSLVSRGASSRAKIHGSDRQASASQQRLAASGIAPTAVFLSASPHQLEKEAPVPIDPDLVARFEAIDAKLTALAVPAVVDTTALDAANAALAAAEAAHAVDAAALAAAQTELEATKVELAAKTFGSLQADPPVGGLSASLETDLSKQTARVSSAFQPPKRA